MFLGLVKEHPSSDVYVKVGNVDAVGAAEEAEHKYKLLEMVTSTELVLPVVGAIVTVSLVWAFLIKYGRRSCCE